MRGYLYQLSFVAAFAIVLSNASSCKKEEYIKTSPVKPEMRIEKLRNSDNNYPTIIKLYKDTVYILDGDVERKEGEQLIIEEGTTIKAGIRNEVNSANSVPSAGSITIRPGGVLIANGTLDNPVIFTSNVLMGDQRVNWGGITIEGKSTNNDNTGSNDVANFSGSLRYCRIEFAPLTLRAVGNTTFLENIMVSYVNRDGKSAYNIYGGTFNAKNLISYACGGPADFYITNGYTGKMQNILAYRNPFFGSTGNAPVNALAGVFIENNANNPVDAQPVTSPLISNLSVIGPGRENIALPSYSLIENRPAALVTTKNANFNIRNSLFLSFPKTSWILDDSLTVKFLRSNPSAISYCFFNSIDPAFPFYLPASTYQQYNSLDFRSFALSPSNKNGLLSIITDFLYDDIYNYNAPVFTPIENSVVLSGANFSDVFADASFFTPVSYLGAFGSTDWTKGWANFTPLKTNYNFPE